MQDQVNKIVSDIKSIEQFKSFKNWVTGFCSTDNMLRYEMETKEYKSLCKLYRLAIKELKVKYN